MATSDLIEKSIKDNNFSLLCSVPKDAVVRYACDLSEHRRELWAESFLLAGRPSVARSILFGAEFPRPVLEITEDVIRSGSTVRMLAGGLAVHALYRLRRQPETFSSLLLGSYALMFLGEGYAAFRAACKALSAAPEASMRSVALRAVEYSALISGSDRLCRHVLLAEASDAELQAGALEALRALCDDSGAGVARFLELCEGGYFDDNAVAGTGAVRYALSLGTADADQEAALLTLMRQFLSAHADEVQEALVYCSVYRLAEGEELRVLHRDLAAMIHSDTGDIMVPLAALLRPGKPPVPFQQENWENYPRKDAFAALECGDYEQVVLLLEDDIEQIHGPRRTQWQSTTVRMYCTALLHLQRAGPARRLLYTLLHDSRPDEYYGDLWHQLASVEGALSHRHEARAALRRSEECYRACGCIQKLTPVLFASASLAHAEGKVLESMLLLFKVIRTFAELGDKTKMQRALNNWAVVLSTTGYNSQAQHVTAYLAKELSPEKDFSLWRIVVSHHVDNLFRRGLRQEAVALCRSSMEYIESKEDYPMTTVWRGLVHWIDRGDTQAAMACFNDSIRLSDEGIGSLNTEITIHYKLTLATEMSDRDATLEALRRYLDLAEAACEEARSDLVKNELSCLGSPLDEDGFRRLLRRWAKPVTTHLSAIAE